ncbi:outer membrane protein assembly factor BamE [Herminiimonas fonticola]|uniref:Outer membrane protein assembly factor BamE n=1 Tax=Herminiimonas fonticola TaxID=303380 RepID=A0A4R6GIX0_9BURK|nr:outer membrane protein assembly factor BamE [Herminiimonas fonticola]RBA25255.1 SmpA / OmlA family [Herminiimonas fonticola]TDN94370.1 outer membrane protein assembly factor BamE [Herminiimonas fonticola]
MQMLLPNFNRAPALAGTFCLLLATALTGCASKNPLMEEPAPVAAKAKPAAPPAVQVQASAPAPIAEAKVTPAPTADATPNATPVAAQASTEAPVAATTVIATPVATQANTSTGVQTKQEKRFLGIFRPYRPDIQQGNFVSQEMVAQLKPGMTQDQVIFLLGTPLLTDVFHADRWDYAFRLQKGNGEITTSRVTVFFKDKLVSTFEGGDLPTEKDYLNRIADKAKVK